MKPNKLKRYMFLPRDIDGQKKYLLIKYKA